MLDKSILNLNNWMAHWDISRRGQSQTKRQTWVLSVLRHLNTIQTQKTTIFSKKCFNLINSRGQNRSILLQRGSSFPWSISHLVPQLYPQLCDRLPVCSRSAVLTIHMPMLRRTQTQLTGLFVFLKHLCVYGRLVVSKETKNLKKWGGKSEKRRTFFIMCYSCFIG